MFDVRAKHRTPTGQMGIESEMTRTAWNGVRGSVLKRG